MNTPYTEFSRAAVESATRLSKLSLASAERMIALQVGFAKESIAQATNSAQTVAAAKDVQELLAMRALAVESAMERFAGYSRTLFEVAAETQSEFAKLAGERIAGLQQAATTTVGTAVKATAAVRKTTRAKKRK
ncbi:phasin family protein [Usitatibacter palustris]|uniref:Phasin domain-containing protein n=1 Tax=Usitatibacter palustris TaxID=2732487 RepID=A0A6M4H9F4_9PROT|nr:phasin family protein [Usitatibacter palustris]QJR15478.1 hypothetical protein DSM104440_02299 [Usitatibacter palustris]